MYLQGTLMPGRDVEMVMGNTSLLSCFAHAYADTIQYHVNLHVV